MIRWLLFFASLLFAVTVPAYADSKTSLEVYELQEGCGKQAAEAFKNVYGKEGPWVTNLDNIGKLLGSAYYSNHYNKKLNKCFMLTTYTSQNQDKDEKIRASMRFIDLADVNENSRYGQLITSDKESDKKLISCHFLGEDCHSEAEWNSLIAPYMNE